MPQGEIVALRDQHATVHFGVARDLGVRRLATQHIPDMLRREPALAELPAQSGRQLCVHEEMDQAAWTTL